ncbi:hypothetical protein [Sporosarcina sp. Te-1]|uniref:hypothetical protein n=1 Tax=Sporosarcina sp. Te-1 TaxID=2818390 RepID=UPI001A9F54F6|nr:hypothetical protein [Sporosarcina sp. Te-1]QTD40682.1 hypothetical protein J3U78_18270 [Sporosarcina sp. Te-1]
MKPDTSSSSRVRAVQKIKERYETTYERSEKLYERFETRYERLQQDMIGPGKIRAVRGDIRSVRDRI